MSSDRRGLYGSARRLLATGVGLLRVRLDLLALDLEVSTLRLFDAAVLALVALLGIGIGLVLLCALVLLLVQDAYRLHALAVMVLVLLGAGGWGLATARDRLRHAGAAFEATRAELARDAEALAPHDRG